MVAARRRDNRPRGEARDQELDRKADFPRNAARVSFRQFLIVVREADKTKTGGYKQDNPCVMVGQIDPKQRAEDDRNENHQPAHGRCASFLEMRFGSVFADGLAFALFGAEPADQARAEQKANDERGQQSPASSERDVPEQVEADKILPEGREEMKKHAKGDLFNLPVYDPAKDRRFFL
jgi:hypothetical protein